MRLIVPSMPATFHSGSASSSQSASASAWRKDGSSSFAPAQILGGSGSGRKTKMRAAAQIAQPFDTRRARRRFASRRSADPAHSARGQRTPPVVQALRECTAH